MTGRDRRSNNEMGRFGGCRVYVGDIGRINRTELEREFGQYGPVIDVWMGSKRDMSAQNFAFVVYRYPEDAEEAVRDRNGRKVCGRVVRVEHAKPVGTRGIRSSFGSDRGLDRDRDRGFERDRHHGLGRERDFRDNPPRAKRSRSRSRSRSNDRYVHRSNSHSPVKNLRVPASPDKLRKDKHRNSPQRKAAKHRSPSMSPEPKSKKSMKIHREMSISQSPPPARHSRPKKEQMRSPPASSGSRTGSSRSSSSSSASSVSLPPKKKKKREKKQPKGKRRARSGSPSPQPTDGYDAHHYQPKKHVTEVANPEQHMKKSKPKSSKHKKKSRHVDSEGYSSSSG